jgi:TRAP-type C4-dicarboxylate transport system substrate-binding protein
MMMNKKKSLWVILSVCILVIFGSSLLSVVHAAGKTLVIHDPAMSRGYTKAFEWWAKEVEKETNNEINFKFLWGGPLGGFKESLDSLKNSVYDLSMVPATYVPSQLPLWTVFEVPFISSSMWAFGKTLWDMKDIPVLKNEYESNKVKMLIPLMPTSFEVMSRKPLRKLSDFKGLKIRAYGMFAEVLNHFGAQSVSIASAEIYENMQRGVVDAAILPWPDFFVNYRVNELSKYGLITGGMGYIVAPFCISMNTWNQISKKNQEIMLKLAEQAVEKNIEISRTLSEPAMATIKKQGIEVNQLSTSERDQMVAVAKQSWDKWVKDQEKDGHKDARMVMDTVIKTAKQYEAKDPYR